MAMTEAIDLLWRTALAAVVMAIAIPAAVIGVALFAAWALRPLADWRDGDGQ